MNGVKQGAMPGGLLVVTNLYADPWDATRGTFNQQQFQRLGLSMPLTILVPVPWTSALRHPFDYVRRRRAAMLRMPHVDYVLFWYPPGVLRSWHAACLFLSLLVQRFSLFMWPRHRCVLASWGYPDAVAVAALARLRGTPFVAKVHGSDINVYSHDRGRRWQIRWALNQARRVVAVSQALAQRMAEIGVGVQRTSVLYNGVDLLRFYPQDRAAARAALGYRNVDRVLLFVGNLKADKGCIETLQAFAGLVIQHPTLRLVFAGDGDQRASLQLRSVALGLGERVRFAGRVPHEQLCHWYAAAEVLCLPSHNEGTPNVVLEAMACGTPVVATQVGGVAEVLPEFAGLMVPPQDAAALQAALQRALAMVWDAERIVAHARRFDWADNVRQLKAMIEEATA